MPATTERMTTRRVRTTTPQVHLAAARACEGLLISPACIDRTLAGEPLVLLLVDEMAEACEAAGLSVQRDRHTVTVGAGRADVEAPWGRVRERNRRRIETLHANAVNAHEAATAQREARRERKRAREVEAASADFADLDF